MSSFMESPMIYSMSRGDYAGNRCEVAAQGGSDISPHSLPHQTNKRKNDNNNNNNNDDKNLEEKRRTKEAAAQQLRLPMYVDRHRQNRACGLIFNLISRILFLIQLRLSTREIKKKNKSTNQPTNPHPKKKAVERENVSLDERRKEVANNN
jgi:hypothetical protein